MDKKRIIEAVVSIVLSALIALLSVFGYHVTVVEPQISAIVTQVELAAQ